MNREALSDFLKCRRAALQPGDVGLRQNTRRRATGLRREEVAQLADISTDFYTRLEQKRGSRPSEQTVEALGRALRLNQDEQEHLLILAGHYPPPRVQPVEQASAALRAVLDCLDTPAQIISDVYVTLAQNRLAVALLGSQTHQQGFRSSLIYQWFTEPQTRDLYHPQDHQDYSRNYVAALRAAHHSSRACVESLLILSPEFAELWELQEVARRPFTVKRFLHPLVGALALDCQTLTSDNPLERLVIFTPSTPQDAARLDQLRQVALQSE